MPIHGIELEIHTNRQRDQHYILLNGFYILLNDGHNYAYKVVSGNFPTGIGAFLCRVDLSRSYVTNDGHTVIQAAEGQDYYFNSQPEYYLARIVLDEVPKNLQGQGVLW